MPRGGVFLDVGAHVGHYALRLARKAERVYAVEANPETAATLRRNAAVNDITNVTVVNVAAWDELTTLYLSDPNGQTAGGSTRTVEAIDMDGSVPTVQAMALDDNDVIRDGVARLGLHLVKLDVEGADLHALRGMVDLLRGNKPTLFIECHDAYGYYEREQLEKLLTTIGYRYEVAFTYMSTWTPDGVAGEPKAADYLVCRWAD